MNQIEQLQAQRKDHVERVKLRDKALKLSTNRDFKELILEEFCVQDAARFVQQSADPNFNAEQRADALALAQSSGHLRRWLHMTILLGNRGEAEIQSIDKMIEEIREFGEDEDFDPASLADEA